MSTTGLEKRLENLRPYGPGENHHTRRRAFETATLESIKAEYDPDNTLTAVDRDRLRLAARHFTFAHYATDANEAVRSTRMAEYLLNRIKPREAVAPSLSELGL